MFVQAKLQFQSVLDQVFPAYVGYLENYIQMFLYCTLSAFPTSKEVLEAGEETISKKIHELCKSRSQQWACNQAEKLMKAANQNPFQQNLIP